MKKAIKVFSSSFIEDVETNVNEFLASDFTDNPEYVKLHVTEAEKGYTVTIEYYDK